MTRIYTFNLSEAPQAAMFQRILAVEGIATTIRNDRLSSALGEIPFTECFPELWVLDDSQAEQARKILTSYLAADREAQEPWTCPECHEQVDGIFSTCWNCGYTAPDP